MSYDKRYKSAIWADYKLPITIVGLGGVGKGVAVNLALNGHSLQVYDGDTVEMHNCIPQGYYPTQIGMKKTDALKQELDFYPNNVLYNNYYWDNSFTLERNVIACPDKMDVRVKMFNDWVNDYHCDNDFFIDIRMLAEYFEIYFISSDNNDDVIKEYTTKGLSNEEPAPVNCTFTQTRYVANMCHGKVVELINKHIVNIKTNTIVYEIPLYTRYDANI
ncbi:MAG: hypothetical protein EBR82_51845 [Caulobacteraceae bacterium]|nr:hypothetical protein [Caulobacteraceae bacterium]